SAGGSSSSTVITAAARRPRRTASIIAVPTPTACTNPSAETSATSSSSLDHIASTGLPAASSATSWTGPPACAVARAGAAPAPHRLDHRGAAPARLHQPVRRDLRHVLVIARPHRLDRVAGRIQRHELDRAADLHGRARGVRPVDAARLRGYRGDTVELRLRRRGRLLAARQREGEENTANGHGVCSPPAGTAEGDAGGMPPGGITAHCTCSCIGYFTAASVAAAGGHTIVAPRSEEHTSELQSRENLVCRLLLEKKN